jgi:hypothetical protein
VTVKLCRQTERQTDRQTNRQTETYLLECNWESGYVTENLQPAKSKPILPEYVFETDRYRLISCRTDRQTGRKIQAGKELQ